MSRKEKKRFQFSKPSVRDTSFLEHLWEVLISSFYTGVWLHRAHGPWGAQPALNTGLFWCLKPRNWRVCSTAPRGPPIKTHANLSNTHGNENDLKKSVSEMGFTRYLTSFGLASLFKCLRKITSFLNRITGYILRDIVTFGKIIRLLSLWLVLTLS